jgi:broad specificity phosphatase PhoE
LIVFTHGLAIKFLLAELLNLEKLTAYKIPIDNTSITQLCYKNGELMLPLAMQNNTEHLQGL